MTSAGASRTTEQRSQIKTGQIEVGGRIGHLFHFPVSAQVAYDYFSDIPGVFKLLPDVQRIINLGGGRHRIMVGAADGYGHTMSAIFDVETIGARGEAIYLRPFSGGPAFPNGSLSFRGDLWAEALFNQNPDGSSAVQYSVEMLLDIPLPGVFQIMPRPMLQTISDTAVSLKMRQMINGFVRSLNGDFGEWVQRRAA